MASEQSTRFLPPRTPIGYQLDRKRDHQVERKKIELQRRITAVSGQLQEFRRQSQKLENVLTVLGNLGIDTSSTLRTAKATLVNQLRLADKQLQAWQKELSEL